MAIRKEKYVDITSKLGGASVASRRSMTARVFTTSAALGFHRIAEFHNADEVMEFFGSKSKEYQFAVKYFGHVSKSVTKPEKISFAGWGGKHGEATNTYKTFDVEINSASLTDGGVVATGEDGIARRYNTISETLEALGDDIIANVTLNTNVVYLSQTMAADAEFVESLKKATGMSEFTVASNSLVLGAVNADDIAVSPGRLVNGLVVGKKQIVNFDLNGHIFAGDTTCFVNLGTLTIGDSVGTGRAFTTNFGVNVFTTNAEGKVATTPLPHSSKFVEGLRATCEVVRNFGDLTITGGWFGTATCFLGEALNETTWGNAIGAFENSVTTINGGQFTNVTYLSQSAKVAADTGTTTILKKYDYHNAEGALSSTYPYAAIVDVYKNAQVVVNGGVFFGLANDIFEIVDFSDTSLDPAFGVVEINGGEFVSGYTDGVFYPDTRYGRQSIIQCMGDPDSYGTYPSQATDNGGSIVCVYGGNFKDNVSPYSKSGEKVLLVAPGETKWDAYHFTGFVYVENCNANFTFSQEFKDSVKHEYETLKRGETPVEALSRVDALNDDFGSFCFVEKLTAEEIREVALWNKAKNFKYLYSIPVTPEDCLKTLFTVRDLSGVCYTLDKFDASAEYMPMALFAATKYDRANATKVFMYQQFDGETPSVVTSQEADKYDAFDIDGLGTCIPVNYLGATQQAGSLIPFYQDGYNADGLDTACYCNEVWLKDAISVELLNTFIAVEKMPANDVGEAMCRQAITAVLLEGIRNGTVEPHKELDNVQRTYVDQTAATEGAWQEVRDLGYWLNVVVKHRTLKGKRVQYYADYVLIYSKGDAVRKVEGSDILI